MRVVSDIKELYAAGDTAVAIGFFDGVHLGHQAVLRRLVSLAAERHLTPCALTFSVTPETAPKARFSLLTQKEEQDRLLASLGIEVLYRPDFTALSSLSPEDTVQTLLIRQLRARLVVAGGDLHFGKNAAGDADLLHRLGAPLGLDTVQVPVVPYRGEAVSSTRIRRALEAGQTEDVTAMLGRPFSFVSPVEDGAHLGRRIGFPTINQPLLPGMTLPAFGVYYTKAELNGRTFCGVTNVGVKPTVGGTRSLAETNLLGVSGDYYGAEARLSLLHFARPEQKFDSISQLAAQIAADRQGAEAYFSA